MIRAGSCFCPYCGLIHKGAFYKNANKSTGVWLRRNLMQKYELQSVAISNTAADGGRQPALRRAVLKSPIPRSSGGVPRNIKVRFQGETQDIILERVCPNCAAGINVARATEREIFLDSGKYPLYIIAMVGNRSTGKTSWLKSVAYHTNIAAVDRAGYPYTLKFRTLTGKEDLNYKATEKFGRGHTTFLEVCQDQDVIAHVLLLDLAGELYESDPRLVWNLIGRDTDHGGADAFVFVEPAPLNGAKTQNIRGFDSLNILKDGTARGEFEGKPIAFVYTHADELLRQNQSRSIPSANPGEEVPLVMETTFRGDTSYTPDRLIPRVALENFIVRAYQPAVLTLNPGENVKGFLVQSCKPVKEAHADGTVLTLDDFSETINVMDPLLWTLNKLGLFPLEERER